MYVCMYVCMRGRTYVRTYVYVLSLACSSNSLPPIYLKFHPNFVGYLPPFCPILLVIYPQFCWLCIHNFVGNLPPILWAIHPQSCAQFTPNFVGNLAQICGKFTPNFEVMFPKFGTRY